MSKIIELPSAEGYENTIIGRYITKYGYLNLYYAESLGTIYLDTTYGSTISTGFSEIAIEMSIEADVTNDFVSDYTVLSQMGERTILSQMGEKTILSHLGERTVIPADNIKPKSFSLALKYEGEIMTTVSINLQPIRSVKRLLTDIMRLEQQFDDAMAEFGSMQFNIVYLAIKLHKLEYYMHDTYLMSHYSTAGYYQSDIEYLTKTRGVVKLDIFSFKRKISLKLGLQKDREVLELIAKSQHEIEELNIGKTTYQKSAR